MRRFEYIDEKSSKFWEIGFDASSITARWGRIGTDGKSSTKAVANPQQEAEKKIKAKLKKGYVEVTGGVSAPLPTQTTKPKRDDSKAAPVEAAPPKDTRPEQPSLTPLNELENLLDYAHTRIGNDDGLLYCQTRHQIYKKVQAIVPEESFRLVQLRLATLCAQTTRPLLEAEGGRYQEACDLLDELIERVDSGNPGALNDLKDRADTLFEQTDLLVYNKNNCATITNEAGQQTLFAVAAVAQAIRLDVEPLEDKQIHSFSWNIEPFQWMTDFWAAIACSAGRYDCESSNRYHMAHYWQWYLDHGVLRAHDLSRSVSDHGFEPPPQSPPHEALRFLRPMPRRAPANPRMTRFAYFDGYVEKVENAQGRTLSMAFFHRGKKCHSLNVFYDRRYGNWSDGNYIGQTYDRGKVEEIHLGNLGRTERKVPLDEWVQRMERKTLRNIATHKFWGFLYWAVTHWERPFEPGLHLDDLRHCKENYAYFFQACETSVAEESDFVRLAWSICSLALGEDVDRALELFTPAWFECREKALEYLDTIKPLVGKHFADDFWLMEAPDSVAMGQQSAAEPEEPALPDGLSFLSREEYDKLFDQLWESLVPASGQAKTVQGEILRIASRLKSEAYRNGNMNWDGGFRIMTRYLQKHLLDGTFSGVLAETIQSDLSNILEAGDCGSYCEDDVYLRIIDRSIDWGRLFPEPIPHKQNPKLHR